MTAPLAARILPLLVRGPLTLGQLAAALDVAPRSLGSPLASLQRRGLALCDTVTERGPDVWEATGTGREVVRVEEARRAAIEARQGRLFE